MRPEVGASLKGAPWKGHAGGANAPLLSGLPMADSTGAGGPSAAPRVVGHSLSGSVHQIQLLWFPWIPGGLLQTVDLPGGAPGFHRVSSPCQLGRAARCSSPHDDDGKAPPNSGTSRPGSPRPSKQWVGSHRKDPASPSYKLGVRHSFSRPGHSAAAATASPQQQQQQSVSSGANFMIMSLSACLCVFPSLCPKT